MNTNPDATVVLCFGDSNTYGQREYPDTRRFPANVRWTGVLQQQLGDDYYVIEEGLPSRTTDLEYDGKPGRNGKTYLKSCIRSHNPVDVVILMLGTNDLKIEFNRSAAEVAVALEGLVADVIGYAVASDGQQPKIVLVSPVHMDDRALGTYFNQESIIKSRQLASVIKASAARLGCVFVDAAEVALPGKDGIHLTEESHAALAKLLAKKLFDLTERTS